MTFKFDFLWLIGFFLVYPFLMKVIDWLYGKIAFKELIKFRSEILKCIIGLIIVILNKLFFNPYIVSFYETVY